MTTYRDAEEMLYQPGSGSDAKDARRAEYPNYLERIKDVFLLARTDPTCNYVGPGRVQVIHLMPSHRIVTRGAVYFRADDGLPVNLLPGVGDVPVAPSVNVLRRETPDRGGSPVTSVIYSGDFPANTRSIDDASNFLPFAPGPAPGDPRAFVEGFAFSAHSQGEDQILVDLILPPIIPAVGVRPGQWRYKWSYEPGPGLSMLSGEWELLARSCRAFPVLPGNRPIVICAGPES